MPKKKAVAVPLVAEDREELLNVVRAAGAPLDAAKVAKLAKTTRPATTGEVLAMLEDLVTSGLLRSIPAATAKGKPLYWDRDPSTVGRTAVVDLVYRSPEPITAKDVKKLIKLPWKLSEPDIASMLSDESNHGAIWEIPPKTAKGGLRYWKHDAAEYGRLCLLAQLRSKGPQTKSQLRSSVKWLDDARFEQVMDRLVKSRELFCHPTAGSSGTALFSDRPPAPEPYLKDVGERLAKVVEKLRQAEVSITEIRRAVVQMMESAGVSLGSALPANGDDRQARPVGTVDLAALMKRIEPRAESGALVTAHALRQAAQLSKSDFDELVLRLARQGQIALHEHDFASSLSAEERESLVTDSQGRYYVGMALRSSPEES